jgi:hypothetical protein
MISSFNFGFGQTGSTGTANVALHNLVIARAKSRKNVAVQQNFFVSICQRLNIALETAPAALLPHS